AGLKNLFIETVGMQNDFYHHLYEQLRPYVFEKNEALAENPANRSILEGWAKEDARYAIALATETQLGMTINARNLELMLRRLAASPLAEARLYSEKLYAATRDIAPSLIRYTQATDYDLLTRRNLREFCKTYAPEKKNLPPEGVRLLWSTPDADTKALAALLFASSVWNYDHCLKQAKRMDLRDAKALFKTVFENIQAYDAVLRELENVDLQFELTVSASCFAQLKRHRMSTIISQDYDPALGVTVPPAIRAIGKQKEFKEIMRRTNDAYFQIQKKLPLAAVYVLTNAHRKRVLMKLNARELYHLSRMRVDAHAQWDIRKLSEKMLKQSSKVMPLTLTMACGKDGFPALRHKIFPRK
ncbi:MAG TPA: thymidylate synthase (FAD), partial [Syntrophaceae bacterium]|nr:thymidylate synthase (FAD) [Syntrophaceae bacterium]